MTADNDKELVEAPVRNWDEAAISLLPDLQYVFCRIEGNGRVVYGMATVTYGKVNALKIPQRYNSPKSYIERNMTPAQKAVGQRENSIAKHNSTVFDHTVYATVAFSMLGATWDDFPGPDGIQNNARGSQDRFGPYVTSRNSLQLDEFMQGVSTRNRWKIEPATLVELENLNQTP